MKKFQKLFLLWILIQLFFSFSFASNVSPANKAKIDTIMTVVERDWGKEPIVSQISKYEKFIKAFKKVSFKDNDQKEMIMYLVECFQKRVEYLKTQVKTQDQIISNVDRNRVKEEWLAWHNYEREQKWRQPYTYNDSLNYTSFIRAQQIAKEQRKTWSTHARKLGDWYRNTDSIKNRFSDLWVNLTYFSESNAYGYYNCKKMDCTQEMIEALKKCFNRTFLDRNHYPAVVSSVYDQIWLWVATNWTYVWLTTHYWKDIK